MESSLFFTLRAQCGILKTVPMCFCPPSLSQRYDGPSILAYTASGTLEGDIDSSEEPKDHH